MVNPEDKTGTLPLPVVAIDGARIKAVREAKKLTQLYVASVVGVTTDTISRWENNRYPTVKRDNAEKLATALEVCLPDILREEEPVDSSGTAGLASAKRGHRRVVVALLVAATVLAAAALFLVRQFFAIPVAERDLPAFGAPAEIVPVQLKIDRKNFRTSGFIVKEGLPAGWRFLNSLPPAAGKSGTNEIKWLIPAGTGPVTISYTVQVSPGSPLKTKAAFTGEVVAHVGGISRRTLCGGDAIVAVDAVHWADGDGDGRIDDNEIMPAYYLTEEMKGFDLDWKEIEAIWSGKGYRWDARKQDFEVFR